MEPGITPLSAEESIANAQAARQRLCERMPEHCHKQKPLKPQKSRGLGDTVEKVLAATGVKKIVDRLLPGGCGCNSRRDKLNRWWPY